VSAKILGDRSAFPSIFEGFPLPWRSLFIWCKLIIM
jgi:hypothetical protein